MSAMSTKYALEKYRFFPYVAWGTVILFAGFVYHLTVTLYEVTSDLRTSQAELEAQVQMPAESVHFNSATATRKTIK